MSDTYISQYIKFLPPIYRTAAAEGIDPDFLTRFLLIFEVILGRAVDQLPDETPSSTSSDPAAVVVTQLPRKGTAMLVDVLPDFFYPQLAPLFPEESEEGEYLPPFTPAARDLQGQPASVHQDDILALLNSYVGAAPPTDTQTWAATTQDWLADLLSWLSSWFALDPGQAWDIDKRRAALANGLNMCRERGTAAGLEAVLRMELALDFEVVNNAVGPALVVGQNTQLADSYSEDAPILGGIRPYSFVVRFFVSTFDYTSKKILDQKRRVTKVVEANRPAHAKAVVLPTGYPFVLGKTSVVNVSTLLPLSPSN